MPGFSILYRATVGPGIRLIISREGYRLLQDVRIARYEIFPEDERHFFFKAMDSQICFVPGEDGYATELIFSEHGDSIGINRVR